MMQHRISVSSYVVDNSCLKHYFKLEKQRPTPCQMPLQLYCFVDCTKVKNAISVDTFDDISSKLVYKQGRRLYTKGRSFFFFESNVFHCSIRFVFTLHRSLAFLPTPSSN